MDDRTLDSKISDLDQRVNGFWIGNKDGLFWKETWNLIKLIGASFKEVRYPTRREKDASRERFESIVNQVKEQSEAHRRVRDSQAETSGSTKQEIISLARDAWPRSGGFDRIVSIVTGLYLAEFAINAVFDAIESLGPGGNLSESEKEKRRLLALNQKMKAAWEKFKECKHELLPKDRQECFKVLEDVQNELNLAWDEWKEQGDAYRQARESEFERKRSAKRELISEMRSLVRNADDRDGKDKADHLMERWKSIGFAGRDHEDQLWNDFSAEMDRFYEARRAGAESRLRERLDNQVAFADKMRESVAHDEGVLEDKREKLANVFEGRRADEIRAHLEEVIESLERKIASKTDKIEELENEIEELKRRLRDF